ncbi:MAG: SDR family NAD(P)-dependent oxidoreductase [Deltaproteobacteria bacterium]|nr:SDR family NAD(P)-dependent oxidoreductase [Deltaproteobacteria bacterium]
MTTLASPEVSVLVRVFVVAGGASLTIFALIALAWLLSSLRRRRLLGIDGRWIVVTGCDSGLGQDLAGQLASRGARVVACCFTEAGAKAALAHGVALAPCFDLSDEDAIVRAAREIEVACGGALWALVHNAGIVLPGFIDYQPMSFLRRVMEVNFFAPALLTKQLLPCLRKARGRITFVSSVDGIVSLPGNAPYDASKFAIEAYADALRAEQFPWGVHVSVVNPATMRTPMAMGFFEAHRRAWEESERLDPDGEWRSAYPREWLDAYVRLNTANLERIAQDPRHAVSDIKHSITAVRPRLRYLSGALAKTLFYALWVGPEAWSAWFKRALIRPRPVQLPPSPSKER